MASGKSPRQVPTLWCSLEGEGQLADIIMPIPKMPRGLRDAAMMNRLVPFIGAGASKIAGCPNWNEFADKALEFLIGEGKFSHSQLAQLRHLPARVKLSIARGLERQHEVEIKYDKILDPANNLEDPNAKGQVLYQTLAKLGRTFVTTNYDKWLDRAIGAQPPTLKTSPLPQTRGGPDTPTAFYQVKDLTAANLNRPNSVIHLHGSVDDPNNMIMTTQQYVDHYKNDRMSEKFSEENYVLTFLEYLFENKTVLFIGYGLEELEILEYAIGKARSQKFKAEHEIRHYLLQGFFSHEYEVMKNLKLYYRESGIELIPFLRDQKDWDQLIEVLKEFVREAPASEPLKLEERREMRALLE